MNAISDFVYDIWYFAGLSGDVSYKKPIRVEIAGEPIMLSRKQNGELFALRDICPHRAAPLSAGVMKGDEIECPYHGWRFGTDGKCSLIPALTSDQEVKTDRISVRHFPVREDGHLLWVYISKDSKSMEAPACEPPQFDLSHLKPTMRDGLVLNCHVDHAVIGLMDPAHGPYVHRQWWWRSEASMHEKAKKFEPRELGFAMARHSPSSNSFAYKLLGGKPETEITFRLPGIRTEDIRVGDKKGLLSFTAVTPIDEKRTRISQVFFTNMGLVKLASPIARLGARAFLRQDADMVDLQQTGLKYDPKLMLIDDADTQAKWYHGLKKAWAKHRASGEPFKHPVKAKTLKWRS